MQVIKARKEYPSRLYFLKKYASVEVRPQTKGELFMNNGWSISETKQLFNLVYKTAQSGKGLSAAFSEMAEVCGKSVNSIRNYYYSQLKLFEMVPAFADELGIKTLNVKRETFTLFSKDEINKLLENVLIGKAKGQSVRAIIADLALGDKKLALRLQNKYRSMIAHHRERVEGVMKKLGEQGTVYYNPYLKRTVTDIEEDDNVKRLADYISSLDKEQMVDVVKKLFVK